MAERDNDRSHKDKKHSEKAVVLLSGGLDSTTVLAIAKNKGFTIHSLSFFYGQRHEHELAAARKAAQYFEVARHLVLNLDMRKIGGSALTDDYEVPKENATTGNSEDEIPITYVPARNTLFLSHALAYAEVIGALDIFIGVNAVDYSGYPDCRPAFIAAFEKLANLATRIGVSGKGRFKIHTPLMNWTKARIIKEGMALGVDYALTHSCYDPTSLGEACGLCESCCLRKKGFEELGVPDPTIYGNAFDNENK